MKALFHKLKKCSKVLKAIFFITFIAYVVSLVFIFKELLSLSGIETVLRIIFIVITSLWCLTYFIWNLVNLVLKRKKTIIITSIITIILAGGFIYASIIIGKLYGNIIDMVEDEYTLYTTNVIALKATEKLEKDDKLGMIKNKSDIEGYKLAKELIKNEKLKNEVEYYEDYYSLLNALYDGKVKGIFVSSNYAILFASEDKYSNIATDTHVLYEYSKKYKNTNNNKSTKKLTEPFSILLMGVDSEKDGLNANAAFNGDTLILITFNPKTLTATMFSMPRDIYVPIACNNNRYNKINSAAAYGTNCVINTVQKLTDIKIDYYAKINFKGFIDLVDALGGVDVDVEQPDYSHYVKVHGEGRLCESNEYRETDAKNLVCMNTGMQHLNGKQALAYARNRHGFLQSDLARNKHQQQIVEAIAKKSSKIKSFNDFEKILNAITKNIATNMTKEQILSFYDIFKDMLTNSLNGEEFVNIKKTYLETYSLPVYLPYAYMYTSALGYYDGSLNAIKDLMKENLELKDKKKITTFGYKYGENYEINSTGKGITSGSKLATVPNFIGQNEAQVRSWGSANGVNITTSGNGNVVVNQSVAIGVLAKSISSINIELGGNAQAVKQQEIINDEKEKEKEEEKIEEKNDSTSENTTETKIETENTEEEISEE